MINSNDAIRYTNVVSRKYRFHYREMKEVIADFLQEIDRQKATVKGPLFYSINNVPTEEWINGEFFMPIEEDELLLTEQFSFHSYFSIESMLSHCIFTHFEALTEVSYRMLLDFIEHQQLIQTTPIFHILSGDRSLAYVYIKIGYAERRKPEPEESEHDRWS
jgi:effector-binding domain-containing protein